VIAARWFGTLVMAPVYDLGSQARTSFWRNHRLYRPFNILRQLVSSFVCNIPSAWRFELNANGWFARFRHSSPLH